MLDGRWKEPSTHGASMIAVVTCLYARRKGQVDRRMHEPPVTTKQVAFVTTLVHRLSGRPWEFFIGATKNNEEGN